MQVLVLILAIILFSPLSIIFFLYGVFRQKWRDRYFFEIANSLDQTLNAIGKYLLNDIFVKKDGYGFGKGDETISSVIGKNQISGKLSKFGIWFVRVFEKFDKDHFIDSIEIDP